ncbi:MAG: hypothetical protein H6811_09580 [Phycisphaeraceae bacterium]|nr:hypothetical protein [Phycisphaeraceae bacterium]
MRPSRIIVAALAGLLGGCASNPWPKNYIALDATQAAPVRSSDLLLVEFEEAVRDRPEPGFSPIGYASFSGEYSSDVEDELRRFAMDLGADRVAWGARFMHAQRTTTLTPTFDTVHSRTRGSLYDPRTGTYYDDVDLETTHATTRYVPTVNDEIVYAFRAVFYRADSR